MGVKDWYTDALYPIKILAENPSKSINVLAGLHLGIDTSTWIHAAISKDGVALKLGFDPSLPWYTKEIIQYFKTKIDVLENAKIKVTFVFDGTEHCQKKVALAERKKKRDIAQRKIDNYFELCELSPEDVTSKDRSEFEKNLQKTIGRPECVTSILIGWMKKDNISFVCAPFEAEWQLVKMEKDSEIDGIITTDGDAIALGGNRVIYNIDWGRRIFNEYNEREAISAHSRNQKKYKVMKYGICNFPIISCLLGNDYTKGLNGIGKVNTWKVCDALLNEHGSTQWKIDQLKCAVEKLGKKKNSRSKSNRFRFHEYVWIDFKQCVNLIQYCPVANTEGCIVPLIQNSICSCDDGWSDLIGFSPSSSIPSDVNVRKAMKNIDGVNFIHGNVQLQSFEKKLYLLEHNPNFVGHELPLFAVSSRSFVSMPDFVLRCWIVARLSYYPASATRPELEEQANELKKSDNYIADPQIVPKQYNNWIITEVLEPANDHDDWDNNGWYEIINDKALVKVLNEDDLMSDYVGTANIFNRVMNLIRGGNFRMESVYWCKMISRVTHEELYVFRALVVPSMKSEVKDAINNDATKDVKCYTNYLVFGKEAKNSSSTPILKILDYPYSVCGCYDGRECCSHLLAFRGFVYLVQNFSKKKLTHIFNMKSPVDVQNIMTPCDFFGHNFLQSISRKKK